MEALQQAAQKLLGLQLTVSQVRAFRVYARELEEWNRRMNLTAITDPADVEMRHFLDSLSCLLARRPGPGCRVMDVGTGAGFPGIPLKIVCPGIKLTLVEATEKKTVFLRHIVETLQLEGVAVLSERAETLGQASDHRERYDWVLARAVAEMRTLAEYLLPLCRIGGRCIAQKGEGALQEVAGAQHAIHLLGGRIAQITSVELPTIVETRYLVDLEKVAATPPKYPRRPGIPSKRPIT